MVKWPFNSENEGKPVAMVTKLIYFWQEFLSIWITLVNIQPGCQKGKINLHIKTDMPIFIGLRKNSIISEAN